MADRPFFKIADWTLIYAGLKKLKIRVNPYLNKNFDYSEVRKWQRKQLLTLTSKEKES